MDRIANIAGAIVTLAIITTIVSRPNSARIINAAGGAFSRSIRSAMGR